MSFLLPNQIKYNKNGNRSRDISALHKKYGTNSLTDKPRNTFLKQYLAAFGDPIIKILLIALALNLIIAIRSHDIYEPLGIAVALFLATFVSTLSEYGSESAFLKLKEAAGSTQNRVLRDKKVTLVDTTLIAVGDVVFLSAGERVPADGIIVEGSVRVDNSALNGESAEVVRNPSKPLSEWSLSDPCQLFMGSVITSGDCIMVVGRVGDSTFFGSVATEVQKESGKSPLTERLYGLAKVLSIIGYGAAALVFCADLFNSLILDNLIRTASPPIIFEAVLHALTLAITVVVVAIPEGLPMMITVVLSSNMHRLRRDNVLVRKLVGIETGGSLNILFCDKTGTLTKGKLAVDGFFDSFGSYHRKIPDSILNDVMISTVLNNDAMRTGKKAVGGNATDRALIDSYYNKKYDTLTVLKKIPFDSNKKYSAVLYCGDWYVKGAPEVIFKNCKNVQKNLVQLHKKLTQDGKRVIALAKGKSLSELNVIGIVSISDKIRHDARYSVKTVRDAGINVCMVTGDNADTAKNIAAACGILTQNGVTLTSEQMSKMTDDQLAQVLPRLCVVSRALPTDKSRLVRVSKSIGLVCGMTGDGINDAPALKQADVGFAMGSGTEVAKQAGDIVILDDNFTSISKAILYGRTIFKSIRKFIVFQLTMNLCAVGISIIGPFIGIDTPVTVMQMLWINIIMDTLAGLAYAGEPPRSEYMLEKPILRTEHVLNKKMASQIFAMGGYSLLICTLFLSCGFFKTRFGYFTDDSKFLTAFFALFIFLGIFAGFAARCDGKNVFRGLCKNRAFVIIFLLISVVSLLLVFYGGEMFRTVPLEAKKLCAVISISMSIIPFDIMRKILFRC